MKLIFFTFLFLSFNFEILGQRLEIYGFIFTKIDSLPILQAKVALYNEKDSLIETIFSNETGKFIFKKVASGTYHVEVTKKEYVIRKITDLKIDGLPNCALRIPLEKEIK